MGILKADDFITETDEYSLKDIGDYLFKKGIVLPTNSIGALLDGDSIGTNGDPIFIVGNDNNTTAENRIDYISGGRFPQYQCASYLTTDEFASSFYTQAVPSVYGYKNCGWIGGSSSFSISYWADIIDDGTGSNVSFLSITISDVPATSMDGITIQRHGTPGELQIRGYNGEDELTYPLTLGVTSNAFNPGWHHYGLIYDASEERVYWIVDGSYEMFDMSSLDLPYANLNPSNPTNSAVWLGINSVNGSPYTLKVQDIMWNPEDNVGVDVIIKHFYENKPWVTTL